jgi:uncharacterized protein YecE (DUF72 family)
MSRIQPGEFRIGTCSWNYDSWAGLVYSWPSSSAAGYLPEYAKHFRTAEVDSFFYRIPDERDVRDYLEATDDDFSFTVKVTQDISLTHLRKAGKGSASDQGPGTLVTNPGPGSLVTNPGFLNPELFAIYLERIGPMLPRIDAIMLEFEYLNKEKMRGVGEFMRALEGFAAALPPGIPVFIECRNGNYLVREYFQFLREKGLGHVFSEKLYLPHIEELYARTRDLIQGTTVIRLLGGDRSAMEKLTGSSWHRIVQEQPGKAGIARMVADICGRGGSVVLNINNHYEGSAPLTAQYFQSAIPGLMGGVGA